MTEPNPLDLEAFAKTVSAASDNLTMQTRNLIAHTTKLNSLAKLRRHEAPFIIKLNITVMGANYEYNITSDHTLFGKIMDFAIEDAQKNIEYYTNLISKGLAAHPLHP